MAKKLYFLFNPVAGRGQIRTSLADVVEVFTRAGYETTVRSTEGRGAAEKLAREFDADLYDYFVCSGGDGTLDEAVTGIMQRGDAEKPVTVGYIPAGSTNDFGASLGISTDMKSAAETIVHGHTERCDIGKFNAEAYFVYVAAFGLFTEVSYSTPQDQKNLLGHSAYILQAMRELSRFDKIRPYHIRVTTDHEVFENDYAVGMITNSRSVGGFEGITGKHVDLSDGLFEVTLIRMPKNPVELNGIITNLLASDLHNEYMDHVKTSRLIVESEESISWTRDGEYGGDHTRVELENLKQVLQIRTPDPRRNAKIPEGRR
jgi:diacylglycerol kinase (ATP)